MTSTVDISGRSSSKQYLQEVSDVSVGTFGVWTRDFEQGALLTNNKNVHELSDVVAVPSSDNQEICLWHLVQVDRGTEEVIFKSLREKD